MMSSGDQCRFWNKKVGTGSQFLITAPSSLDNYFRSQQTRIRSGYIPLPIQIPPTNPNLLQQPLPQILSKKLRNVKLSPSSQQHLQTPIKFLNKSTYDTYTISLDNLFQYFLEYKRKDLVEARKTDRISQVIVRPFLRVFVVVCKEELGIQVEGKGKGVDRDRVGEELGRVFQGILGEGKGSGKKGNKKGEKEDNQCQEELEKIWKSTTNAQILEATNKILREVQENVTSSTPNINQQKFKIRDLRTSHKLIQSKLKTNRSPNPNPPHSHPPHQPNPSSSSSNPPKPPSSKTSKKIHFKTDQTSNQQHQNQNEINRDQDNDDICYELGLLISDTDRILRPVQEDVCYLIVGKGGTGDGGDNWTG